MLRGMKRAWGGGDQPPSPDALPQLVALAVAQPAAGLLPPAARLAPLHGARGIDLLAGRVHGWPVPDQGGRNTCVAFALKACLELWRAGPGMIPSLSAEFLYFMIRAHPPADAATRGLWNSGAVSLFDGVAALAGFGVCPETDCPYLDPLPAGSDLGGPAPSAQAMARASALRVTGWHLWDRENPAINDGKWAAAMLYEQLQAGRPAAITMPEFTSEDGDQHWTMHNDSGVIADPPQAGWNPSAHIAHAVCVVGYQPDAAGGWFIFRNSVGTSFAQARNPLAVPMVPARGYGAVSARHVDMFGWRIASPGEVVA
jgi:hypothetical protein